MVFYIFFAILLGLIFLGVPIAYALGTSSMYLIISYLDLPLVLIAQNMFSAVNSYEFLAVPFFMLAGSFMSHGGVTKRLISFASAIVWVPTGEVWLRLLRSPESFSVPYLDQLPR